MRFIVAFLLSGVAFGVNAASCPTGYVVIDNPYVTIADTCSDGAVPVGVADSCADSDVGSVCWVIEQLRILCASGISNIKTSTGVSVPLYAEKYTVPAVHIRYNNDVCYGNLATGQAVGAINLKFNGKVYHMVE